MKNMDFKRKLPVPKEIKERYPLTPSLSVIKDERDLQISRVFTGESDKFLLIIGPCSADNEVSVLDYVNRLRKIQDKVEEIFNIDGRDKVLNDICIYSIQ
jgi:3-deoxy-7-phosphoheptulonate synthase